jgi:hypothetical protein
MNKGHIFFNNTYTIWHDESDATFKSVYDLKLTPKQSKHIMKKLRYS